MRYIYYIYQLKCGHIISVENDLAMGIEVYCSECSAMSRIISRKIYSQEADDLEELPE
jgi:hypothetical protein